MNKNLHNIMPHAKKQARFFVLGIGNAKFIPWFSRLEYDPNLIILVNDVVMSLVTWIQKKEVLRICYKPPGFEVWRHVFLLEQLQNDEVMPVDLRFFFLNSDGSTCRHFMSHVWWHNGSLFLGFSSRSDMLVKNPYGIHVFCVFIYPPQ